MVDVKRWVERLRRFVEKCRELDGEVIVKIDISEPASDSDIHKIAQQLPYGIPDELRDFYINGARSVTCRYVIDNHNDRLRNVFLDGTRKMNIGGGLNQWSLDRLIEIQQQFNDWLEGLDEQGDSDALIWRRCMPFVEIPNGDCLALEITADGSPNKVIYLDHDGSRSTQLLAELLNLDYYGNSGTQVIAESFEKFLEVWEEVCYIGPEIWHLRPFIDAENGMITSRTSAADKLRQCFDSGKA